MESAGKDGTVMCVTALGRAILVAPVREVRPNTSYFLLYIDETLYCNMISLDRDFLLHFLFL